jgi:hypothetical protein
MVDDRLDDPAEPGRPKRPPPTLELAANEEPAAPHLDAAADHPALQADAPRRPGVAAAAAAGALSGAVVAGIAWFAASTWLTATPEPQPATISNVIAARIDDLTGRIAKIETAPAPTSSGPVDLSRITARLDELDKSGAALKADNEAARAQAAKALGAAEEARKAASNPAPAAPPDLSAIDARLAQVESAIQTANAKLADQARKPQEEITSRRLAIVSLLDAQVRAGEPFATALAAAAALAPNPATLAPLQPFAATGVPPATTLARALLELPEVTPPPLATSGGLIDRIKSSATKLVKIERTDAASTDHAIFARAAEAARRDDLATAVKELGTLPASERTTVQPWLDRVAARDAARAAARAFANDALAATSKSPAQASQ